MDPLADLPVADQFEALLTREELRRARTDETLVVAVLDLDGLRDANSQHGAAAGTEMLRQCADALVRSLRTVDDVARTGLDEFSCCCTPPTPGAPPHGRAASRTPWRTRQRSTRPRP
jgi:diguanylate cyclase (GGDEF)-like protein